MKIPNRELPEIRLLRPFNAVPRESVTTPTLRIRAEARLAQIVASNPYPNVAASQTRSNEKSARWVPWRQLGLRWAAIPVLAAGAVTAAALLLPDTGREKPTPVGSIPVASEQAQGATAPASAVPGENQPMPSVAATEPATSGSAAVNVSFASWTPTPTTLGSERLGLAQQFCSAFLDIRAERDAAIWRSVRAPWVADPESALQPLDWVPFGGILNMAEQRGDWAILSYLNEVTVDTTGQDGLCLVHFLDEFPRIVIANGGLFRPPFGGRSFIGDILTVDQGEVAFVGTNRPVPAGEFSLVFGISRYVPNAGSFSLVQGRVGDDVASLVLHTATGGDVTASIANGQFVAWWPYSTYTNIDAEGRTSAQYVTGATLTLRDGTILPNQTENTNPPWADEVTRPFLGVQAMDDANPGGVLIESIWPGSPAEVAGLQPGDIVTAINQFDVRAIEHIFGIIESRRVGDAVVITVERAGQILELPATLVSSQEFWDSLPEEPVILPG